MCWMCSKAVKQVAEEDIKTFKVGIKGSDGNFCSYYYKHAYVTLQKYEAEMHLIYKTDGVAIDAGFHSYNPKCCSVELVSPYPKSCCRVSHVDREERYYYLGIYSRLTHYGLLIAECIIPKGAEYYENELGEIVSNKIIIESIKPIE